MKNDARNGALSRAEVDRLIATLVEARLFEAELRPLLLHGLPKGVVASLRQQTDDLSQLRADVQTLNEHAALVGVEGRPLAIWLGNAVALARERHLPQASVLGGLLSTVGAAPPSTAAQPGASHPTRGWLWALALLAIALVAGLAAWWSQQSPDGARSPVPEAPSIRAAASAEVPAALATEVPIVSPATVAAPEIPKAAPKTAAAPISIGPDTSHIEAGDIRAEGASKVKVGERRGGHLAVKAGKVEADGRSKVDVARTLPSEGRNSQEVKVGDVEAGGDAEVNIGVVK